MYKRQGRGRSSVQIEINRALYMDEDRLEKLRSFDKLAASLERLIGRLVSDAAMLGSATPLAAE